MSQHKAEFTPGSSTENFQVCQNSNTHENQQNLTHTLRKVHSDDLVLRSSVLKGKTRQDLVYT